MLRFRFVLGVVANWCSYAVHSNELKETLAKECKNVALEAELEGQGAPSTGLNAGRDELRLYKLHTDV